MSSKEDQGLLSAQVLAKARSFRDDLKSKIRRSPSTNRDSRTSMTSQGEGSGSSPKHKRKMNRGQSFKEQTSKAKIVRTDMERLETERKKVNCQLLGLRTITDGGWTHMVPGSATQVLEAVMEFTQLIGSLLAPKDSDLVQAACSKVHMHLSKLIQWTDEALIGGDKTLDKSGAEKHIQAVDTSVKELHAVSLDALTKKANGKNVDSTVAAATMPRKRSSLDGSSIQNSPLPLTPKEKQALERTQIMFSTGPAGMDESDGILEEPPPKPPLPINNQQLISQSIQRVRRASEQGTVQMQEKNPQPIHTAPPLPPKQRTPSVASIYDNHVPEQDLPPQSPTLSAQQEVGIPDWNRAVKDVRPNGFESSDGMCINSVQGGVRSVRFDMSSNSSAVKQHHSVSSSQIENSSFAQFQQASSHHVAVRSQSFSSTETASSAQRNSPQSSPGKVSIPIHVVDTPYRNNMSPEARNLQYNKRISPDKISNVSSTTSSRSASFSFTQSASAHSQRIVCGPDVKLEELSSSALSGDGAQVDVLPPSQNEGPLNSPGIIVSASKREKISHVSSTSSFETATDETGNSRSSVQQLQTSARKVSQSSFSGSGTGLLNPSLTSGAYNNNNSEDLRLSHYDNFDKVIQTDQEEQFQSLANQIQQLTQGIKDLEANTANIGVDSRKPPLPSKVTKCNSASSGMTKMTSSSSTVTSASRSVSMATSAHAQFEATGKSGSALAQQMSQPVVMRASRSAMEFSTSSQAATRVVTGSQGNGYTHSSSQNSFQQQLFSQRSATCSTDNMGQSNNEENHSTSLLKPPPLPPKRKNVESYMQIFGGASIPSVEEVHRQSMHAAAFAQKVWKQHQMELHTSLHFKHPWFASELAASQRAHLAVWEEHDAAMRANRMQALSMLSDSSSSGRSSDVFSNQSESFDEDSASIIVPQLPYKSVKTTQPQLAIKGTEKSPLAITYKVESSPERDTASCAEDAQMTGSGEGEKKMDSGFDELSVLDDTNVSDQLVYSKPDSDDFEIRGGSVDALIVHASCAGGAVKDRRNEAILYQEVFLTTYRTFISSRDLIEKLLYRYNLFSQSKAAKGSADRKREKLAMQAFSLLIRVVDEMCTDINEDILKLLTKTVHTFLNEGALMLAKILRRKLVEKVDYKRQLAENSTHHTTLWEASHMTTKQYCLLDFHARHIAEQMTLLDAELFTKIEVAEVLLWPQYEDEELSPNLTQFTVHFNKISYWVRTLILEQEEHKDRERFLVKFIKVMKHLRRHNNFNSYLAILSAVNSSPVSRLDWQRQTQESLKECCGLIDSSSSFRAYRQALQESEPPCIPYIGIILQDLTFVHIGNPDKLEEGVVNFTKRWQQFTILQNMKRFKKCVYNFKKDHKITAFFDKFDHSLPEETLWQISEHIKPRGGRKKHK